MSETKTTASAVDRTNGSQSQVDEQQRASSQIDWPYLVGGGVLLMTAIRGGLLRGVALTGAGAAVAYRGARGHWPLINDIGGAKPIRINMTINRPREELFDLWSNPESMARLVPHVDNVSAIGDQSHWEASMPIGGNVEWEAEVTREERPHRIEWQTVEGSNIPMSGSVTFREAAGNKGTEVRIEIHPKLLGGKLGATVASVLSKLPEQQIKRDVQRLKARLEAGEAPTTKGQSHGPRNPFPRPDGTSA